jgi:SAM-dependent methyltransferase
MCLSSPHYTESFFQWQVHGAMRSAEKIVPFITELFHPQSVCDVGCGLGAWLAEFKKNGARKVLGIDGGYIQKKDLLIAEDDFSVRDIESLAFEGQRFDLVSCLEVAEHLSEQSAKGLTSTLTNLSDVVLFGAAIPFQKGRNHINLKWQSYWAEAFAERGYGCYDAVRPRYWNDGEVEFWYRQNLLIYVNNEHFEKLNPTTRNALTSPGPILDVVHPLYWELINRQRTTSQQISEIVRKIKRSLRRAANVSK